jgi:hypothetical protein
VEYLSFCKRARQRATVASARLFMAEVEQRRRLAGRIVWARGFRRDAENDTRDAWATRRRNAES